MQVRDSLDRPKKGEERGKYIYIAGPITGRDRVEFIKHFSSAQEFLEDKGFIVFNPARVSSSLPDGLSHEEYMAVCMRMLSLCGAIFMLKGWKNSLGANREIGYALGAGMEIFFEDDET